MGALLHAPRRLWPLPVLLLLLLGAGGVAQARPNDPRPPPPRRPLVMLDPGHGGTETGAVGPNQLVEKTVNLAIAERVQRLLLAAGYRVLMTRSTDAAVNETGRDLTGNGRVDNDDDLQARVDRANAVGADLFVGIHNNAMPNNPAYNGTEVWYCACRQFAGASARFAGLLDQYLVVAIRSTGYDVLDHGAHEDTSLHKPGGHLFVLGPANARIARPSQMPGAIGESLYLSNAREAELLTHPTLLDAIALGYRDAIVSYFAGAAR